MHTIHIGIGCNDDRVVTQVLHTILDIERRLQQVKLLILVHDLLRQAIAVQRLTTQAEHSLRHRPSVEDCRCLVAGGGLEPPAFRL